VLAAFAVVGACARAYQIYSRETVEQKIVVETRLNVLLAVWAGDALQRGAYLQAIEMADSCTKQFANAATQEQDRLAESRAPLPLVGVVTSEQKRMISSRGVLNDVATCLYLKGLAAERLQKRELAKDAYRAASYYTYARSWDPRGYFWAPAERAADRLQALGPPRQ
jgi:hypothetical protein